MNFIVVKLHKLAYSEIKRNVIIVLATANLLYKCVMLDSVLRCGILIRHCSTVN